MAKPQQQPTYLDLQARIGITKHTRGYPAPRIDRLHWPPERRAADVPVGPDQVPDGDPRASLRRPSWTPAR